MIVYVKNNKGGIGKSSISRNLAHCFTKKGYSSAILSFDSQNDSLILLGKGFEGEKGFKHQVQAGEDTRIKVRDNLDYYPLETSTIGVSLVDKFKSEIERLSLIYDVVIIDGAPSKDTVLTKVGLAICDFILIPVLLDVLSLKAIKRLMDTLPIEKVSCVIPNLYRGTKGEKEIYNSLENFFEDSSIYLTFPIKWSAFENSLGLKGKSIYDSKAKATNHSKRIYDEIIEELMAWV